MQELPAGEPDLQDLLSKNLLSKNLLSESFSLRASAANSKPLPAAPRLGSASTLVFPEVILLESGPSFPGLGVQPPMTSLGNMVGYGREYLTRAPWIMLAPAITIVLTTLAVAMIGDWLRDRLDPTLQ